MNKRTESSQAEVSDTSLDRQLLNRARRVLQAFCQGPGFRDLEPEDLLQDAQIKLLLADQKGVVIENREALMMTVLARRAIDLGRQRIRRMQADVLQDQSDDQPRRVVEQHAPEADPEQTIIADEDRERLYRAIARLPPMQRETLKLIKVEGASITEAAATLGTTEGVIRKRLFDAMSSLRRQFGR